MKAINLIFLYFAVSYSFIAHCQTNEIKHVAVNGGSIRKTGNLTSICVVGEMAVSRFQAGALSGTIGFLEEDENTTPTDIRDVGIPDDFLSVYPNPCNGDFIVSCKCSKNLPATLELWDILGRRLQYQPIQLKAGDNRFSFFNQPEGVIFINLTADGKKVNKKIVIIR